MATAGDGAVPPVSARHVLVLDGPWIHRVAGIAEALADFGATLLYLPPYSPELDPIEEVWSWLETAMRQAAPRRIGRLREAIDKIWHSLGVESCAAWIRHSGYTVAST